MRLIVDMMVGELVVKRFQYHYVIAEEDSLVSVEQNKNLIRSFYQAGDVGDMETVMGLLSDDIVWTNIGSTDFSGTFRGKAALMENLLGPVFSRLKAGIKNTIELMVAEGDYVIVQDSGVAETVDGQAYNNTYCHIFQIQQDKIVAVTEYFDTALAQNVLGSVVVGGS